MEDINNLFYLLGRNLSNKYPDYMIEEYIEGLKHSHKCQRDNKGYNKGDGRVAKIELPSLNKRYYVYTCRDCGGSYYSQEKIQAIHYIERK